MIRSFKSFELFLAPNKWVKINEYKSIAIISETSPQHKRHILHSRSKKSNLVSFCKERDWSINILRGIMQSRALWNKHFGGTIVIG